MATKAKKENSIIGTDVKYVPNEVDYGIRPKGVESASAKVVNEYDQTFTTKEGKEVTRKVVNLLVFDDSPALLVKKVRVPHKDDALEGESFYQ